MAVVSYALYTAREVAEALRIKDDDSISGEEIARDMLDGQPPFTAQELARLAERKRVPVERMLKEDPLFAAYADAAGRDAQTRRSIAANLLKAGQDANFAAEMCGLSAASVRRIEETLGLRKSAL